jgi:hypothetical protein
MPGEENHQYEAKAKTRRDSVAQRKITESAINGGGDVAKIKLKSYRKPGVAGS